MNVSSSSDKLARGKFAVKQRFLSVVLDEHPHFRQTPGSSALCDFMHHRSLGADLLQQLQPHYVRVTRLKKRPTPDSSYRPQPCSVSAWTSPWCQRDPLITPQVRSGSRDQHAPLHPSQAAREDSSASLLCLRLWSGGFGTGPI